MIMRPRSSTICVVDAQPVDYEGISRTMHAEDSHLQFVQSGRAALRINPKVEPDLWIINMDLPDMGPGSVTYLPVRAPGVSNVMPLSSRGAGADLAASR